MEHITIVDFSLLRPELEHVLHLNIFVLFSVLVSIDFITGTMKAILNKKMNSKIGTKGLMKHITVIMLVILILMVGQITEYYPVGYVFTIFYIFEYLVSIMENTEVLGVPYPEFITKRFIQMRKKINNWGEDNNV